MNVLSLYGSHDSSATFIDFNGNLSVIEYERIAKQRYAAFNKGAEVFDHVGTTDEQRFEFLDYINTNIIAAPDIVIHNQLCADDIYNMKKYWPRAEYKEVSWHHISHAACGYYQSSFDEALIVSADGGGTDEGVSTTTKVFAADLNGIDPVVTAKIDFGAAYGKIGFPIKEISKKGSNLAVAGKVMGLCAYGKVREEWEDALVEYYLSGHSLPKLGERLGFNFSHHDVLEGQDSYDLAATSQKIFSELMFSLIREYFENDPRDLVFTGGCALNVLFNQELKDYVESKGKKLYVPPNPNDCGLSLGQYLNFVGEKISPVVYGNTDILDRDTFVYPDEYTYSEVSSDRIANLISAGKIGGIIQGKSEVGPRALGNRSIICDPSFKDMKDILNAKVKFREWFRPFAPVCRLQDKDDYFVSACESQYMSYAPVVKEEHRETLISITHADYTSRLQTVTQSQHKLFYDICTSMKKIGKLPVILNTSFNIKGKPILTTYEDAFHVLEVTELDFVVTEDFIAEKV